MAIRTFPRFSYIVLFGRTNLRRFDENNYWRCSYLRFHSNDDGPLIYSWIQLPSKCFKSIVTQPTPGTVPTYPRWGRLGQVDQLSLTSNCIVLNDDKKVLKLTFGRGIVALYSGIDTNFLSYLVTEIFEKK